MMMDSGALRIINGLQSGFPLVLRPFVQAGARLGMREEALIQGIDALLGDGVLTRFGPFYNAERMGGGVTLAAIRVPADDYEAVAALVNAQPEVAHNYAREHALNMWFVVATERKDQVSGVLARIAALTGLEVFDLPKIEEYRLGFQLQVGEDGGIDTRPMVDGTVEESPEEGPPDSLDRGVIAATQAGLPLVPEPYSVVAESLGVTVEDLLDRMNRMMRRGWIRRIGVATNHYRLGLRGNGMSVWNVPDERVSGLGRRLAGLDCVTHCYRRPRHLPDWPYNLFVMVHGPDRGSVEEKIGLLQTVLGADDCGHMVLHSTRILKKTGLRFKSPGAMDGCSA
ncbi:MAG: Lrp/AsnC family transcriptional regulator [Magnetococcales bacterium]|nr:Lrp/AsnC family transcriptional regulator [Magnetococcales bacterium]